MLRSRSNEQDRKIASGEPTRDLWSDIQTGPADADFWRRYLQRLAVVYPVAAILQDNRQSIENEPKSAP